MFCDINTKSSPEAIRVETAAKLGFDFATKMKR